MQAVFAVTSAGNDLYAAMTRVAVASVRLSNPRMRVVVACDAESDLALRASHHPLIGEVDQWVVIQTPGGCAGFRNRFVKTRLRASLEDAFLFIDSDILVRGDLSELFSLDTDIAGARNHSRLVVDDQVCLEDLATLEAMDWRARPDVFINGGLLYFADSDAARRLGMAWHERWLQSFAQRGSYRDQPSLNASLWSSQARLTVLDDRFNAQFKVSPAAAMSPVAWHYYASDSLSPKCTAFEQAAYDIWQGAELDHDAIAKMLHHWHPWRRARGMLGWLDDLAAAEVIRKDRFGSWPAAHIQRTWRQYVRKKVRGARRR